MELTVISRTLCLAAFTLSGIVCNAQSPTGEFKKHTLTTEFKSEGVAVADVNKDGKLDVIAGPHWYEAPNWKRHDIYESRVYDPGKEYATSFLNLNLDINFDGWDDVIVIGFPGSPGVWYENPKNKEGYWTKHNFLDSTGIGNESPNFVDIDGDGRLDILCADSRAQKVVWIQAPTKKGDTTWHCYPISGVDPDNTHMFTHGIGYGDINKDGRKDVFTRRGWWEGPADLKQPNWKYHAVDLGQDCSHMYSFDVNNDGLIDIISASAHRIGIWWHQQGKDAQGNQTWTHNEISAAFSQSHALAFVDLNKDGYRDLVAGKRFFAHNDTDHDPGAHDPAVIYWFEYTPGKAPYFIPHLIDNDSGAGLNIVTADMNKDKLTDIVIANKKGVFYFENLMNKKKK
ncbi:VCBS repeat-containing protein [Mucilaginibacter limnophilus]|uniref:VCBS repeat-containing protein n=1 Tax=Mucilaginibacter limnophilus TaxID=1932778 RepID=A0A3S2ULR0_9SPHI|nr:VCBS repeat-containing protein [Mucilaginibacter limnophilus]RVU01352.1 VCBS repeat-containing protein [Mucilaginibacter limnophilus]